MGGFDEYRNAMKTRDVIVRIASNVVSTLRPEPKIGEVYSYNSASRTCEVLFPGDTQPVKVFVGRGQNPVTTILDDDAGSIVRVAGRMGNYYILTVLDNESAGGGTPGEDGASAYEVAVEEGFVGDVTAWLASLVGPAGDDGVDGDDGADGADGFDGTPFLLPTNVIRSNIDPGLFVNALALLATGRLTLVRCPVKGGQAINGISFISANQAAVTPTNQIFGLYDSSLNLLRSTANDTTTAWAAQTRKRLALTSSYTPGADGWLYVGIMVTAATVPNLTGIANALSFNALAPITQGTSSTGLTTALPNPAAAVTAVAGIPGVLLD